MTTKDEARRVKELVKSYLIDDFVYGIGIAKDDDGYIVTIRASKECDLDFPKVIDGVRVEVIRTDIPKAY